VSARTLFFKAIIISAVESLAHEVESYHLISKHEHSLEGELALAVVEQIFKTGSQEINDHDIVVTFNSEPMDIRNSN
jgi:hypothetical protein